MNIGRHNYETFFLLYVDKELSAADRKAVDVFVEENPDLQMELLALQQTIFKADDITLEKKDWLYMEDGISALQENLLLYADDELAPADKKTIEALVATDKTAFAEWNSLRQTKLQPDTSVIFADKKSLYKKEEGKVVGIKWWRVAAAALLLGFGIFTGVEVYKNNFSTGTGTGAEVAKGNDETPPSKIKNNATATTTDANVTTQFAVAEQPQHNTTTAQTLQQTKQPANGNENQGSTKNNKQANNKEENNIAVENNIEKMDNNLSKPNFENINRKGSNEYAVTNVTAENNINTSGVNEVVIKTNPVITNQTTAAAIPVAYIEEKGSNDRFLYMDEDKVKRTKLGGFIRKATRMLGRTANIKTGDGLKVAGFEIALK